MTLSCVVGRAGFEGGLTVLCVGINNKMRVDVRSYQTLEYVDREAMAIDATSVLFL